MITQSGVHIQKVGGVEGIPTPAELRDEWSKLSQDDDAWELPEWQKFEDCRLSGGIGGITFTSPVVRLEKLADKGE